MILDLHRFEERLRVWYERHKESHENSKFPYRNPVWQIVITGLSYRRVTVVLKGPDGKGRRVCDSSSLAVALSNLDARLSAYGANERPGRKVEGDARGSSKMV
jgi:hypothetical protein